MRKHWPPFTMFIDGPILILDPHSAISVTAVLRSAEKAPGIHYIALSTAHLAKFNHAVEMALAEFNDIFPPQFLGLEILPRRIVHV